MRHFRDRLSFDVKCKISNPTVVFWSSFSVTRAVKMHGPVNTQGRWYTKHNRYRASKWSRVVWRDTTCLWINITNPEKVHTHTHNLLPDQTVPGTSETLRSASSCWAAQTRPSRRVRNTTFILCLSWTFFCWGWGCPSVWRGWELWHLL